MFFLLLQLVSGTPRNAAQLSHRPGDRDDTMSANHYVLRARVFVYANKFNRYARWLADFRHLQCVRLFLLLLLHDVVLIHAHMFDVIVCSISDLNLCHPRASRRCC